MSDDIKGDIFEGFSWHSSIGIDEALDGRKRFVTRIANTTRARCAFVAVAGGDNLLVHKTTRALWKVSDDNASIEPVFPTDVLTEEDMSGFMEDEG